MNRLYAIVLRLQLWDCNYAIRRVKIALTRHRAELIERQTQKSALETELFNHEHQLIED